MKFLSNSFLVYSSGIIKINIKKTLSKLTFVKAIKEVGEYFAKVTALHQNADRVAPTLQVFSVPVVSTFLNCLKPNENQIFSSLMRKILLIPIETEFQVFIQKQL